MDGSPFGARYNNIKSHLGLWLAAVYFDHIKLRGITNAVGLKIRNAVKGCIGVFAVLNLNKDNRAALLRDQINFSDFGFKAPL